MLMYFFYNLHPLFSLKSSENFILELATLPSQRSSPSKKIIWARGTSIGYRRKGHIELHPSVMGATVIVYYEIRRVWAMPCVVDWILGVGYDDVRRTPVPLRLPIPHQYHTNHIFFSLCIYFLSSLHFFYSNIKI